MQKTAQKRSILNKLKEMTNISGKAAEKFFNPEFKKIMESLRSKDDQIRAIVSGESIKSSDKFDETGMPIPNASPGSDAISLKALLKSAKSSINRREYMSAAGDLGRFHKKMADVVQLIASLDNDVDKVHHEFLFKELSPEQKERLLYLKNKWSSDQQSNLVKRAGFIDDFFYNLTNKRGKALAAWEKRYPKIVGKIKTDTVALLAKSEALLDFVLITLKEMASARATRNLDTYIAAASKITKSYNAYDSGKGGFKDYYTGTIKPYLDKVNLMEEKPEEVKPGAAPVAVPDLNMPPKSNLPSTNETSGPAPDLNLPSKPVVPAMPATPPSAGTEPERKTDPGAPPVMKNEFTAKPPTPGSKKAHNEFLSSLESMSSESPAMLALYIKKYAQSIQSTDLETSINLLKISKAIGG